MKRRVLFILSILIVNPTFADEQEVEQLHRLRTEIGLVASLVEQAKTQFRYDPQQAASFRYDELQRRLTTLQEHIDQHIRFLNESPKLKRFVIQ